LSLLLLDWGRASSNGKALRFPLRGAPVIREGILGQPGSDAFDVLGDGGSEFNSKALEFFAVSLQ
jgi:hypothetical protein